MHFCLYYLVRLMRMWRWLDGIYVGCLVVGCTGVVERIKVLGLVLCLQHKHGELMNFYICYNYNWCTIIFFTWLIKLKNIYNIKKSPKHSLYCKRMFDLPLQTLNQTMIQAFNSTHDIAIYPAWHNKNNLDEIITIKTLDKKQNENQCACPLQN